MVLASPGESISDTGFDSLHRTTQGYGNKVVPGEGELQIGEAGIMLDNLPAIRGKATLSKR
jgi:hypothetical protein